MIEIPEADALARQLNETVTGKTITRVKAAHSPHKFAWYQGYELSGKHHEIYLSDPRRTAPEKRKTVLRHPVYKKE